jgi:hypothetical protein
VTEFILSMCINFVILAGMVARVVSNIVVVPIDCSKFMARNSGHAPAIYLTGFSYEKLFIPNKRKF